MVKLGAKYIILVSLFTMSSQWVNNIFTANSIALICLYSAIVLGLGMTIKPILLILALPINLLTLGLFTFIINGFVLVIGDWMMDGVQIHGFWSGVLLSLVIFIVNEIIYKQLLNKNQEGNRV